VLLLLILFSIPYVFADNGCETNEECGQDGFITEPFCAEDDIFRTYRTYSCIGTEVKHCIFTDENIKMGSCKKELPPEPELPKERTRGELYIRNTIFSRIERFAPFDIMEFSIFLKNTGNLKLKDLKVSVIVYDLGVYYSSNRFDLKAGESITKSMNFDVPWLAKGIYDARIVVSNDKIKKVFHREIIVG